MARSRARAEGGFVITLELVLIFTILGIGLLVGIVAVRNALFVWWQKKQAQTVWVVDSTAPQARVLGPVRDFDEHEAPRLFFIDRELSDPEGDPGSFLADPLWMGHNYRAFVAVRDDRFTSRHRIFYRNSMTCGADGIVEPCIVRAGDEDGDNLGIGFVGVDVVSGTTTLSGSGRIANAGGIGYLYPLQTGPSYGIGRDEGTPVDPDFAAGLPGTLYRATDQNCDPAQVQSAWVSQTVTSGLACEPLPAGVAVEAAKCPDGRNGQNVGDACLPPADPRCVTATGAGALACAVLGNACTTGADCGGYCSADTARTCTVGGLLQCAGTCGVSGIACVDNATCLTACSQNYCCNGGGNNCDTAAPCTTNADCAGHAPPQTVCRSFTSCSTTCTGYEGPCVADSCVAGGGGALTCACPPGWTDYGANCCPAGTVQVTPGQCTLVNDGRVVQAVPVGMFNDVGYTYPFRVNLPPDTSSFELLAPGAGGEGSPGVPAGPYQGPGPIDFENPQPDGVEGPP